MSEVSQQPTGVEDLIDQDTQGHGHISLPRWQFILLVVALGALIAGVVIVDALLSP